MGYAFGEPRRTSLNDSCDPNTCCFAPIRERSATKVHMRGSHIPAEVSEGRPGGLPVLCPVNADAYLAFDWRPADGEMTASRSIEDVFFFVNPGKTGPGQPFPFGRHRFWCPGRGAQRYLVVTRKPD